MLVAERLGWLNLVEATIVEVVILHPKTRLIRQLRNSFLDSTDFFKSSGSPGMVWCVEVAFKSGHIAVRNSQVSDADDRSFYRGRVAGIY